MFLQPEISNVIKNRGRIEEIETNVVKKLPSSYSNFSLHN